MRNFTHSRFLKTPLFFRGKWFYLKCAIFSCFFWFCGTSILIAQTFSATGLPAGIPDGGVISKTITVSGLSGTVADANEVQVSFAISHKWAGDIKIGIIPPGGSEITIVNTIGTQCYSNSDFVSANVITISQNATNQLPSQNNITIPGGTFLPSSCNTKPVGTLASLVGATRNGDWTIKVYDVETIEAGQLHSASITIGNSQCDPPKFTAPTVVKSKCDSPTGIIIVNTTVAEGLEYTINDWASWQSSATFEGLAAGNYTLKVRLRDNKSCEATYENNPVVVSNYPPPTVSASITSVCVGSTITLSPTSGGTWVSSDNSKATVNNAGVVTGISAGSVTFTFTETATGCSATTSSVMVNSLPIVSTPTATVCAGSTITLSPTSGGAWVSSDNSKATVNNAGVVTGVSAGSVTFTFTETATGCSATTSSVTVKPSPIISSPTASVCVGSTITLSPTSGGTWVSSDNSKATVSNAGVVTGISAGSVTFTFTETATGCSATTSSVTVKPSPIISSPTAGICVGSTITLSPTSGGAWVSSDNSKATVSNAGVVTGVSAGSVAFTFTETATGCSATTSSVTVKPSPIISSPTASVCVGSIITLSPTSGGTWVSSDNSKATVSNAGVVTGVSAGSVAFTFTETATGCSVTTSSVTVKPLPTATITGDATVCKGSLSHTITFIGASGTAPYTFTYKLNGGNEFQITTESGTNVASIDVLTTAVGTLEYSLVSVKEGSPNACNQTQTGSAVVTIQGKPTIVLNTLQQTLNEGNTQVFCDTDANPVNGLQFTVSGLCVVGNPVWRVQVGGGSWSEWSATAPVSQLSNNQPHRYQAACDVSCPVTYTSPIELTINYRASVPQNVSLLVDGVTIAAGETKEVCSLTNSPISFTANCGAGELLLYSVDGGEYSAGVPLGLVDNQFHNYRVRCRKSDGTSSCVESESGVMRLKLVGIPAAPTVSLSPTTSCNPASIFSGQSSCGSLRTVWYNATTNVALSSLPSTVPSETSSYYARCQTENGCVSEKSNVVTFKVIPVNVAPIVTVSQDVVCTGTTVTVSANCPAGSTTSWNTGVTTPSFEVAFSNITKQSYWAKCVFEGGCQSAESNRKEVYWQAFVVSLINIGESKSGIKSNDRAAWSSQFITADGGPELDQSTQQSPTLYYVENVNKMAPRYWTIHADACALGTNGSLTFDMLATPEMGVIRSFNTHENNAPYFMYANREGWTELYAQNHPAYGFYEDNGSGGNVYDAGLPKGLYKLSIRYWDMKGWGSIYPSTRKPQGNVLAYQEYWFRIQSKDGVGVGAAREMTNGQEAKGKVQGSDNGKQLTDNGTFATVLPNPVTNILRLKVQDSKGQMVQTSLTDAVGREVLSRHFRPETNTHQEEFGVSELPTGIYFLRVKSEAFQSTLKVVKL